MTPTVPPMNAALIASIPCATAVGSIFNRRPLPVVTADTALLELLLLLPLPPPPPPPPGVCSSVGSATR
jgi:hypothetical protein